MKAARVLLPTFLLWLIAAPGASQTTIISDDFECWDTFYAQIPGEYPQHCECPGDPLRFERCDGFFACNADSTNLSAVFWHLDKNSALDPTQAYRLSMDVSGDPAIPAGNLVTSPTVFFVADQPEYEIYVVAGSGWTTSTMRLAPDHVSFEQTAPGQWVSYSWVFSGADVVNTEIDGVGYFWLALKGDQTMSADEFFVDNIILESAGPVGVDQTTWGSVKATFR